MAAALRILDRDGLADLSMRRLAAELDVQASALYWHFRDKQHLLAAVSDSMLDGLPALRSRGLAARLAEAASALRGAMLAHRDGAELLASSIAFGLDSGAASGLLVEALTGADAEEARLAAATTLHFVLGSVQLEQQRQQAERLGIRLGADEVPARDAFDAGIALLAAGLSGLPRRAPRRPSDDD